MSPSGVAPRLLRVFGETVLTQGQRPQEHCFSVDSDAVARVSLPAPLNAPNELRISTHHILSDFLLEWSCPNTIALSG